MDWISIYLSGYLPALICFILYQKYRTDKIFGKDFVKAFIYAILFSWGIVVTTVLVIFYDLMDWIYEREFWNKQIF